MFTALLALGCGGAPEVEPEPAPWCWSAPRAAREAFPEFDEAIELASELWGLELDDDASDCHVLSYGPIQTSHGGGFARSRRWGPIGPPTWAEIDLNSERRRFIVQPSEVCFGPRVHLVQVLAHEFGHVLGIHDHTETGVMRSPPEACDDAAPTAAERESVGL